MSEIDSVEGLKRFQWSNPLQNLCEKYGKSNKFTYSILGYFTYFEYLAVIWARFITEFEQYNVCIEEQAKLIPKSPGVHKWSPREWKLYYLEQGLLSQLQLDYESFVVFTRVLLNKVGRIAHLLIDNSIPSPGSFYDQKKYFLQQQNELNDIGEKYKILVRDKTDWFDNFLRVSRDKIMIHGDVPWAATRRSPKRGIQFMRAKIINTDVT